MTCIRCQTLDAARVLGREDELIVELYRQIDGLLDARFAVTIDRLADAVSREEHERTVEQLNQTIAKRNAEIARLRKAAS